jgi:hypothetical protein
MATNSTTNAMRFAAFISAANVLIASGFAIAGLLNPRAIMPHDYVPTDASFLFALYAAARTIALAGFVLWAIFRRSAPALLVLGALAGVIQLADAAIGLFQGDLGKMIGPLPIAALQFYSVWRLHLELTKDGA